MSEEVRITSSTGGQKGSKPERYDLIPVGPLAHVARVYGKGAEKYDDRNWERGYDWSLSYAAMQRHMNAFWGGEWLDPETGVPHLACAVFHAFALMEFFETHPEFDTRPKKSTPPVEQPVQGVPTITNGLNERGECVVLNCVCTYPKAEDAQ